MGEKLLEHANLAGTGLEAAGTIAGGFASDRAARYQARQLRQKAKQAEATGSREAESVGKETDRIAGNARAAAAANGGGPALDVIGGIAKEGEYRRLMALYDGDDAAAGLRDQAAGVKYSGKQRKSASFLRAGGTILSAAPSLYEKYLGDDDAETA